LLFALDLALAFILSLAAAAIIGRELAPTGFSETLARDFDLVLWADMGEALGSATGTLLQQLVWVIPLWMFWKAVAHAGLVHALRGDAVRPFWQGVGRYAGRAVLLALLYLLALVVVAVVVGVVAVVLNLAWSGEVGAFWSNFVLVPTLLITLLAVLDLMHDYSRIALVVDEKKVLKAFATGVAWPVRHGQASWLYWLWFLPGLVLVLLPVWLDMSFVAATTLGIWGLFMLQQVVLLARSAVTVGWIGSETAFYEMIRMQEAPLIAEEDEREPAPADSGAGADTAVPTYEPPEPDTDTSSGLATA
jgi:hypothetical protein